MTSQSLFDLPLAWSAPKATTYNDRPACVRTAPLPYKSEPAELFWNIYRAHKVDLNKQGVRVRKDDRTGVWSVVAYAVQQETAEDKAAKEAARALSRATDAAVDLPCPEGLAYLPYQKAGIAFAAGRPAALIADEMGLGKTIQLIGVINATGAKSALVICPASLRLNWQRELSKWLTDKSLTVGVAESGKPFPRTDVVVVNYDILHKFADELRARTWDVLGADEAHYIKNGKARRTKQVIGDSKAGLRPIPASRRILLTGTPIANRPIELWPLISYLDPTTWRDFFRFAKRYANGHHNGFGWDFSGASNLDELQDKLRSTIMVRRLKKDVLTDLPPKIRQVITLPANGAGKAVEAERRAMQRHEDAIAALMAAKELAKAESDEAYEAAVRRLRDATQAAFTELSKCRHEVALAKVPAVLEHLLNTEAKVVAFAHHKDVIAALKAGLEAEGRKVVCVTGDIAMVDRQASVDAFQNDPSVNVFLGNIQAAGVGLTLTASSHVVFAELDWVPGNVSQAEDRCHRIGQRDSVLVQHIVLDGSLDARLAQTIVAKQAVIDQALDVVADPRQEAEDTALLAQPFDWAAATEEARKAVEAARERQAQRERIKAARESDTGMPRACTDRLTRAEMKVQAEQLTAEQIAAIHQGVRLLSAWDPDRALSRNDIGWNAVDGKLGHALAALPALTALQATLGKKLLAKYRRQLGETHAVIFGRAA